MSTDLKKQLVELPEAFTHTVRAPCAYFDVCGAEAQWKRLTPKRNPNPDESKYITDFLCNEHASNVREKGRSK